ncbi:MAG TPA: hypothetical protein EYN18_03670 [Nitrospirales bacterium]|nr:hypothetical protein [Nitrospirales bacterium]HIA13579.1 hypothetical protein [Nitrospirales bacterium]HIB55054.1 hypothetical protein [Nitrospirales bacterium]HIC04800.1 hypothetical protein [Nitrospirales bacterium]HIN33184.1 hypothetical protein [Nitrospirales bacterium]
MTPPYRDLLTNIRLAFPQPTSDPIHDSYFVHSIMRACSSAWIEHWTSNPFKGECSSYCEMGILPINRCNSATLRLVSLGSTLPLTPPLCRYF